MKLMKDWWQSKTIRNTIGQFAILLLTVLGLHDWSQILTAQDIGAGVALIGGAVTLFRTIQGRKNAASPIKGSKLAKEIEAEIEAAKNHNVMND